jgi:membrane protein
VKKELVKSILLFIFSAIMLTIGIIILPEITDFGENILLIVLGCLILLYVYGYLLFKVATKVKGIPLILTLIEMITLTFVAILTMANTWITIGEFNQGSVVIGTCFWIRGIIESCRVYYYQKEEVKKYSIYKVIVNLLFITLGAFLFVGEFIYNYELLYVLCLTFIVLSVSSIIMGVLKLKNKSEKE